MLRIIDLLFTKVAKYYTKVKIITFNGKKYCFSHNSTKFAKIMLYNVIVHIAMPGCVIYEINYSSFDN